MTVKSIDKNRQNYEFILLGPCRLGVQYRESGRCQRWTRCQEKLLHQGARGSAPKEPCRRAQPQMWTPVVMGRQWKQASTSCHSQQRTLKKKWPRPDPVHPPTASNTRKSLKTSTVVSKLPNSIKTEIHNLLANCIANKKEKLNESKQDEQNLRKMSVYYLKKCFMLKKNTGIMSTGKLFAGTSLAEDVECIITST